MAVTTAAILDDSQVEQFDIGFDLENSQRIVYPQLATTKRDIGAKSIQFTRYGNLAIVETALTDGTAVVPVAMTDSSVILTPEEYGLAVELTSLANLQSSGKARLGAGAVAGKNAAESENRIAYNALAASTNVIFANAAANEAAIVEADTIQTSDITTAYADLDENDAAQVMGPGGPTYLAVLNPHVASDVKELDGFNDDKKYADPDNLLLHEIGTFKGFRFLSTNGNKINTDGGLGFVDTYGSIFMGDNAFGFAVSQIIQMSLKEWAGPLPRGWYIGWVGTFDFGITNDDNVVKIISASAQGNNAA